MVVSPKDTSRESKNDRKSLKRSEQESKIRRRTTVAMTGFLTSCSVSDNAFNDENVDEIVLYIMIAIVAVMVIAGYIGEGSDDY